MKKFAIFSLFVVVLSLGFDSNAQTGRGSGNRKEMKEKVDAMKIGFITDFLDLTSEEAKMFWPVYNKYQDELDQLRKTRRNNLQNDQSNLETMSDAELEKLVDSEIIFHQSELDIQKKFHPQFKKVLPMVKVARLYRAEELFKKKLLEMIREKRQEIRQEKRGRN